jgi:hypothetical protein
MTAQRLRGSFWNPIVFLPVVILRPSVEAKTNDRNSRSFIAPVHEHRPKVARPSSICWEPKELDSFETNSHAREDTARPIFVRL